jgi:hypothetical protein
MTNGGIALLTLTVLFWLPLSMLLRSIVGQTATGDASMGLAINWIYACILVVLTWICLSGLMLVASGQDVLPAWASVVAAFLCPASGAAALGSLYLLSGAAPPRWPMAVPVVIPGLLAGYVFALYHPSTRALAAGLPVSLGVWAAVLMLTFSIAPAALRKMDAADQKRLERKQEQARADAEASARKREANLAKLKTMTSEMPLTQWYELLDPKNAVRKETVEALRTIDRRQGDIEEMVARGIPFYMTLVPELDLKPTPELCRSAQAYLAFVAQSKLAGGQDPYPYQADEYIDDSLQSVKWFTGHGCNCDPGIAEIEKNVRAHYLDSAARRSMLETLAGLKQGH